MRFKRTDLPPALHRENKFPTKINIFNKNGDIVEGDNLKFCPCCKKPKPIRGWYMHGKGKTLSSFPRKYKLRGMCVDCYDAWITVNGEVRQRKGRFDKPGDDYKPTPIAEEFFY